MKNCTASAASFASIALCALLGFSLVAFAATKRGPCVGGGTSDFGPDENIVGDTMTVVSGTVQLDQVCADLNESGCTETFVATATRKTTKTVTYKRGLSPSGWIFDSEETDVQYGRTVC